MSVHDIYILQGPRELISNIKSLIMAHLIDGTTWSDAAIDEAIAELQSNIDRIKPDTTFVVETEYVDKVYRNSYYQYFSTKRNRINRNCIRLSLFLGNWSFEDFRDSAKFTTLTACYGGFLILRPTIPSLIGRSHISPRILQDSSFLACSVGIPSSANSIKLLADGFPHQSQDAETITCAETAIWSVMEYFSHKYSEYKTALPRDIRKALESTSFERQLPSKGLTAIQISYALRSFGFGTVIYGRLGHEREFEALLSCYMESGIPVIVGVNSPEGSSAGIAHAMVCIGYENRQNKPLVANATLSEDHQEYAKVCGVQVYDNDSQERDFVFIDDNYPPYQRSPLKQPCRHYQGLPHWIECELSHFVVPLHSKIHLDALNAKACAVDFLLSTLMPEIRTKDVYLRTYLASQRSFKDWIARGDFAEAVPQIKEYVLGLAMSKFVWVSELTLPDVRSAYGGKAASGLIILDATEPNTLDNNALIFACLIEDDRLLFYSHKDHCLKDISVSLHPFTIFENLKNYTP